MFVTVAYFFSRLRQFLVFTHADHDRRLLRRMALINKFLSPKRASDLGDVDTYFFFEKIFRSEIRIWVTVTSFLNYGITITHILISDRNIFLKKINCRHLLNQAHILVKGI